MGLDMYLSAQKEKQGVTFEDYKKLTRFIRSYSYIQEIKEYFKKEVESFKESQYPHAHYIHTIVLKKRKEEEDLSFTVDYLPSYEVLIHQGEKMDVDRVVHFDLDATDEEKERKQRESDILVQAHSEYENYKVLTDYEEIKTAFFDRAKECLSFYTLFLEELTNEKKEFEISLGVDLLSKELYINHDLLYLDEVIADYILLEKPSEEIQYWRKSNQIHRWFVEVVQNDVDDCGEYRVTKDQLEQLKENIETVLEDRSLASSLLPTGSGFMFGSDEYDVYYFKDLEISLEGLNKAISLAEEGYTITYSSSW